MNSNYHLPPFEPANYLKTAQDVEEYLAQALEAQDWALFLLAAQDVQAARLRHNISPLDWAKSGRLSMLISQSDNVEQVMAIMDAVLTNNAKVEPSSAGP